MSVVEVYPFDVNTLSKGDWISPEQCEDVVGVKRDDRRYSLRLMRLSHRLAVEWERERGGIITVVIRKDGINICTDDDAVVVNAQRHKEMVAGIGRALVRQTGVDTANLSTQELRDMTERERVKGAAFLAGGKAAVKAAMEPYKRQTPGLPPKR